MRHLLVFFFIAFCFSGFGQGYYIKKYHVDVFVRYDGVLEIEEQIKASFTEPRRGIKRNIPYRYSVDGKELTIKISDIEVKNFETKVNRGNGVLTIRIGSVDKYLEGDVDYNIKYKVNKAIVFKETFSEFYYDVIPTELDTKIEDATFNITFERPYEVKPDEIAGFRGGYGSRDTITTISIESNGVRGVVGALAEREGATVAIKLNADVVKPPTLFERWYEKYGKQTIASLFLFIFSGLFFFLWRKYGKDYDVIKAVRYTPPMGINPSEAGAIIDGRVDNIDILSMIPYWAQQGFVRVKRIENKWTKDDYELEKLKELPESASHYEHNFFSSLFSTGDLVKVSDLTGTFYQVMTNASSGIKARLDELNIYYKVSDRIQIVSGIFTFLVAFGGLVSGIFTHNLWLSGAGIVGGIIGLIATIYMRKRTREGVEHYQEVLGFKEFIKAADKDRIERFLKEDPMYFEKTLPYAMVFGYAKIWGEKFNGLLTEPPTWYVSNTPYIHGQFFNAGDFTKDFNGGMEEIKGVFTSIPESSGGGFGGFSGDGGGGFSGGGFGGGGGSSW
jgi:uncharacterized membrane protein